MYENPVPRISSSMGVYSPWNPDNYRAAIHDLKDQSKKPQEWLASARVPSCFFILKGVFLSSYELFLVVYFKSGDNLSRHLCVAQVSPFRKEGLFYIYFALFFRCSAYVLA